MNDREHQQIDLIASHELGLAKRTVEERVDAVFADHSAKGLLHSGATVKVSVRVMGELANAFVVDLSEKLKAVADDPRAFEILSATVNEFLEMCQTQQMPSITRMASGRLQEPRVDSVSLAAQALFDQMRADVEAKLAIFAFDFEVGGAPSPAAQSVAFVAPVTLVTKKGGRPPSEFWDDMWAAIATALYDGTLKPKTQADVERAMAEWIENNGHNAADSTVRGRARRLWDRLSATDA